MRLAELMILVTSLCGQCCKVLQNLSNFVLFGKKEHFLVPMNDFIERFKVSRHCGAKKGKLMCIGRLAHVTVVSCRIPCVTSSRSS